MLERFFNCGSLAEQASLYWKRIHPRWWNPLANPFATRLPILLLFGAHLCQARRVRGQKFTGFLAAGVARALTPSRPVTTFSGSRYSSVAISFLHPICSPRTLPG